MSGKGGVGKTTIAVGLAYIFSKKGKTILLDFDLSGPSTKVAFKKQGKILKKDKGLLPIKINDNLDLLSMGYMMKDDDCIAWRYPKKLHIYKLFLDSIDGYDYVIIDMPPGIGPEHQLVSDTDILLVTTSQNLALSDSDKLVDDLKDCNFVGVIENMSGFECEKCHKNLNIFSKNGGKFFAKDKNIPFLGFLSLDPEVSRNLDSGKLNESENFMKKLEEMVKNIL